MASVLAWLGGLYALPFFHNLNHRPDHTHADAPHTDGRSRVHEHPHPHEHAATASHEPERQPLDPDHGEGSILHFAAVVVGEELALLHELVCTVVPVSTEALRTIDPLRLLAFLARGPPA